MAKNWQYGRLRAVALQGVMWLIFGASLGLAAFIDHRRSGMLDVRLGEPLTDGRLVVRPPVGWDLINKEKGGQSAPSPRTLTLVDFDRQGRERRRLQITQEQQTGRPKGPELYLEQVLTVPPNVSLEPQPFPMLGQNDGVLIALMIDSRLARLAQQYGISDGGLYACAVMSDGLAVTLRVTGDGAYGPSNRQLLRLVADNMRVTDGASATSETR